MDSFSRGLTAITPAAVELSDGGFGRRPFSETMANRDWRLESGVAELLRGATFAWRRSSAVGPPNDPVWRHHHCALCWSTFGEPDEWPRRLTSGYVTDNGRLRWICEDCFSDFRGPLSWEVTSPEPIGH